MTTPGDEIGRGRASAGAWPQLCDLEAVAGDDKDLSAGNAVKDLSPVVAQLSNGN